MIKSLHLLRGVDSGFDENNVLIFNVNLPQARFVPWAGGGPYHPGARLPRGRGHLHSSNQWHQLG